MKIGEAIRVKRIERGITQKQLGELCVPPMAESNVRKYELGKANPKFETIKRFADALGIHVLEFYTTSEDLSLWKPVVKSIEPDFSVLNAQLAVKHSIPVETVSDITQNTWEWLRENEQRMRDFTDFISTATPQEVFDSLSDASKQEFIELMEEQKSTTNK